MQSRDYYLTTFTLIVYMTQFVYFTTSTTCTSKEQCDLHGWIEWDCRECCKPNADPNSAYRQRKICCPTGSNLDSCLKHCNKSRNEVERWGPCVRYCICINGFHFSPSKEGRSSARTTREITLNISQKTQTLLTRLYNRTPVNHAKRTTRISVTTETPSSTERTFKSSSVKTNQDQTPLTHGASTKLATNTDITFISLASNSTNLEQRKLSGTSVSSTDLITELTKPKGVSRFQQNTNLPLATGFMALTNGGDVTTQTLRTKIANAADMSRDCACSVKKSVGPDPKGVYIPILVFIFGLIVGCLLTSSVVYLKKKKHQRVNNCRHVLKASE